MSEGGVRTKHARELRPVDLRQYHIEQYDVRPAHLSERERVESPARLAHHEAVVLQHHALGEAAPVVVVHYEDGAERTTTRR